MINPIEEIKNRLDIAEVIGSYIKLQKAGSNFRAVCPFHSEKKPSFFVSPARQIWHCFGCQKGGDIFGFVKEIEGVEFGDALRILAQKAGVELKRERPELATKRQNFYEICELATQFFQKQLEQSKTGKEVQNYLVERGIKKDSIKEWKIGYSPDTWKGLCDFLVSKKYTRDEIEKTGLIIKNEKGNYYDRFRSRIMFPIFDLNSQVVGFGGRIFGTKEEKEVAKYVNTPNTFLYDKSRILYGLNKAKVEIRKNDNCILVEGYTDVIMAFQSGSRNIVSTSGTALTIEQLKILKRYTDNLLTAFDMDIAGDTATKRGIDLAQMQGFNIKVITMPEGMDPADVLKQDVKKWEELVKQAKSILDFYFETAFSRTNSATPEGKKDIAKILLPVIKKIPNKIEQSYWVQQLAKKLGVKEENITEEMDKIKTEEDLYGLEPEETVNLPQKTRREMLEERLAIMILKFPDNLKLTEDLDIFSSEIKLIFNNLKEKKEVNVPESIQKNINRIYLKAETEEIKEKEAVQEINICLKEIKYLEIRKKLNEVTDLIRQAEIDKDSGKVEKLKKEFDSCSKLLNNLENNYEENKK